jgi:hypothetical protein
MVGLCTGASRWFIANLAAVLLIATAATSVWAGAADSSGMDSSDDGAGAPETLSAPAITIKPVMAPRNSPAPIPHTSVLDPSTIQNFIQGGGLRPQSVEANAAAQAQGVSGKPGVLQTESAISSGITLFQTGQVCNGFNTPNIWRGQIWTRYFDGWGSFAADDGYFQAKNVTFDIERVVGPGSNYRQAQRSLKIASNQPYDAGVMSPSFSVRPGATVRVRVAYLIYNHDTQGRNTDYASMGIIPKLGERASYVQGYRRGEWDILEQEITATGDQFVVMLQGHSPDAINSNIYFDNVEIYVNGRARTLCRD